MQRSSDAPRLGGVSGGGVVGAMRADAGLRDGLTVHRGRITEPAVAECLGLPFTAPAVCLN